MTCVFYTAGFIRDYKKLPEALKDEVREKITLFEENPRTPRLRLHKLRGNLQKYLSFSVNYRYRIVVEEDSKGVYALLAVGDHDVYK